MFNEGTCKNDYEREIKENEYLCYLVFFRPRTIVLDQIVSERNSSRSSGASPPDDGIR